jgi:hypothetical protein
VLEVMRCVLFCIARGCGGWALFAGGAGDAVKEYGCMYVDMTKVSQTMNRSMVCTNTLETALCCSNQVEGEFSRIPFHPNMLTKLPLPFKLCTLSDALQPPGDAKSLLGGILMWRATLKGGSSSLFLLSI